MNDKLRINWLEEKAQGGALVSDDNGHWALVFDGFQNVPIGKDATDIQTTFWVERDKWENTIRKAIDKGIKEESQ